MTPVTVLDGGPKPGCSSAEPPASLSPPSRVYFTTLNSVISRYESSMKSDSDDSSDDLERSRMGWVLSVAITKSLGCVC